VNSRSFKTVPRFSRHENLHPAVVSSWTKVGVFRFAAVIEKLNTFFLLCNPKIYVLLVIVLNELSKICDLPFALRKHENVEYFEI